MTDNNPEKTIDNGISIEQSRIDYLRKAIREKYGYETVSSDLRQNCFRDLYVRNPVECILKYCFKYNDANPTKKKGLREFNELWRSLVKDVGFDYIPVHRTKGVNNGMHITMHDLREYILSASAEYENVGGEKAITRKKTMSLEEELTNVDLKSHNSDEAFNVFFHNYCYDMSEARSSLRYYFIKYVYFFISFQILDFIKTLKQFAKTPPEDYVKDLNSCPPSANWWSIEAGIIRAGKFGKLYQMIDTNKGNDINWQPTKVLLELALNHLPLCCSDYFRSVNKISPVFLNNKGEKIQISKIVDKTLIFPKKKETAQKANPGSEKNLSKTEEEHKKLKEAVNNLTLRDFEGFPIDFKKLYHLLFEKIIGKGEIWDIYCKLNKHGEFINDPRREFSSLNKKDAEFIIGIIDGKYDLSRSALLMALASIKGAIRDNYWLRNDEYSLYEESCFLSLTRINNILSSSGYLRLPDNAKTPADRKVDNTYKKVFSGKNRCGQETWADKLCDSMSDFYAEYKFSPLPFDIAEIPSDKIGYKITGRG